MHEGFIQALPGSELAGRYVVERILGRGGMGVVVAARNVELDQEVAIKLMFPEHAANKVLSGRFKREARLAAKTRSVHLVRVWDVGKLESGVPYLVMEMLHGRDLGEELVARSRLPVKEAVDLVLQTAGGIAELHALGIVHRDLKPANLFIANDPAGRTVKILDFGISKEQGPASTSLTATESILGTPRYMSPEQIRAAKDVDARADIWSMGVILYEMLSGRGPYEAPGESVGELFAHVLFTEPRPLRQWLPDLPPGLEEVVFRCIRRERAHRFNDVAELAEALRPFAAAESHRHIDTVCSALGGAKAEPPTKHLVTSGDTEHSAESVIAPTLAAPDAAPASSHSRPTPSAPTEAEPRTLDTSTRSVTSVRPVATFNAWTVGAAAVGLLVVGAAAGMFLPSLLTRPTPSHEVGAAPPGTPPPPSAGPSPGSASPPPATTPSAVAPPRSGARTDAGGATKATGAPGAKHGASAAPPRHPPPPATTSAPATPREDDLIRHR